MNDVRIMSLRHPSRNPLARGAARALIGALLVSAIPPAEAEAARTHTYAAGWKLVSIPLQPADGAPASIFADVQPPLRLYDYVAGQTVGVGEPGFRNVAPGRAYWMLNPSPTTVDVRGDLVSPTSSFTVPLTAGWNAVGTPWLSEVEWSDARVSVRSGAETLPLSQAIGRGWVEGELRDPNTSGGYATVAPNSGAALEAWQGYLAFATVQAQLIFGAPPADATPPTVHLASPEDGSSVTGPIEVIGTVDDDNLVQWTLEYAHGRGGVFVPFASGESPVVGGVLGTLDPTLLLNGLYVLRLTALDFSGHSASTSISVIVKGNRKVGHFSVSFVDMELPVAGLPIRLTRTYDSRDKRVGDFGFGWRLDISDVSLQESETPGFGWTGAVSGTFPGVSYCLEPSRAHAVSVTLPGGQILEFDAQVSPRCQAFAPVDFATVSFTPRPGTHATLVPVGGSDVTVESAWPGPATLFDYQTGAPFEPQRYVVTMDDGRTLLIDKSQGLQAITDLNGNQLTIGPGGIFHNSGAGIVFQRTGNRITSVTDPDGNSLFYGYDANGDLASFTNREGGATTFTYATDPGLPAHHLEDILYPRGAETLVRAVRNEYYEDGRLKAHIDADGRRIEYTHDPSSRQELITDRNGGVRVLEYDDRGNVVREIDASGRQIVRTFDDRDNRLSETAPHDPGSAEPPTTYTYDDRDNVTSTTDPEGNTTEFTYNARRQVLSITDPRQKTTTNVYDTAGNLTSTTDALGQALTFNHDGQGNVRNQTAVVNGTAQTTTYEHDPYGNLTKETDALGHETSYSYDARGNRLTQTTTRTLPSGSSETLVTRYEYDRNGRLVKTTDPDGSFTRTVNDAMGRQIETYDKLDRKTAFEYDDLGRLIKTTHPDQTFEENGYDAEGRRTSSRDRAGRTTTFEYDPAGRLTKTIYPDSSFTENVYDDAGRLGEVRDARGKATTYGYDLAGRRTSVRDALGNVTSFAYDQNGNQTSVTDARNQTTRLEYDELNRHTRTNLPDGTFNEIGYDTLGRRISERDQAGKLTRFQYDSLGRLRKVTDAKNQETSYAYDDLGNRISQTDANGHVTRFEYDQLGRETARILPDGDRETKGYDAAGNLRTRTDFMGRTTTYSYDDSNRLASRHYPNASENVSFTYTATGRRETATDQRGTTTYGYDGRDRLASILYPDGRKLEFGYDSNGNRTNLTARVNGQAYATGYRYDAANRLDVVTDPLGRAYDHGYDPNGNRASLAYPNGTTTSYVYDSLNRLRNLTTIGALGTIQGYAFTLGPAGNRTRIQEHDGTVRDYGYDDLYRLTSETVTRSGQLDYQKAFTYDPVGNRQTQLTSGNGAAGQTYDYDTRDRLLTDGLAAHGYDDNGNLTTKSGEATYTWDHDNRLVGITKTDGTVVAHQYDADGNRVQTATTLLGQPTQTTNFLVDTSGSLSHVAAETDGPTGALKALYVRGDDLLSVIRPNGGTWSTRFYHADGIGSIRKLTDEFGTVTDSYEYSAFGELLSHTGTDPQPYAFTGEPYDPNVGFQYHRARWMDPRSGRFVGMDPFAGRVQDPPSLHKYLYAAGDPSNRVDPTGQETLANLAVSFSITAILVRATLGIALGAADAALRGYPIRNGAVGGAVGGVLAPLVPLRIGLAFTTYGVGEALYNGEYDAALFRAATFGFGYILQTRGFGSFADFKRFWGPAGNGRAWHHIVEQTPGNRAAFGKEAIHNPSNMVPLAHGKGTVHSKISGFYSSKQPDITGSPTLTVRQWLAPKSYAEQYQFGLEAMARFGGGGSPINISGTSSSWFWPAILAPFEEGDGFGQDDSTP